MNDRIRMLCSELTVDSRISNTELGVRLSVSPQAASYLIRNNAVREPMRPMPLVDAFALGFTHLLLACTVRRHTGNNVREFVSALSHHARVIALHEGKYGYDYLIEVIVPAYGAFDEFRAFISETFEDRIGIAHIFTVSSKRFYPRSYLTLKRKRDVVRMSDTQLRESLSDDEKAILVALLKDARASYKTLGSAIRKTPQSAARIKASLEQRGIIRGYTVAINHAKLGIANFQIFIRLASASRLVRKEFFSFVRAQRNIVALYTLVGSYDAVIMAESFQDIPFMDELRSRFDVEYVVVRIDRTHVWGTIDADNVLNAQ